MRIACIALLALALPVLAQELVPPLPGLLRQLEEQDGNRRHDAAKELGLLGRKEAAEPLFQRLGRERVTQVAGAIALALERLSDPRGRRALDGWLDSYAVDPLNTPDADAGFRAGAAAQAAAEGKLLDYRPKIERLLRAKDQWVVWVASSSLGKLGDKASIPQLSELLGSSNGSTVSNAAGALLDLNALDQWPAIEHALARVENGAQYLQSLRPRYEKLRAQVERAR